MNIDHEAAYKIATALHRRDTGSGTVANSNTVAEAYLDLHAQLTTERGRVARIRQAFIAWSESPHYVFDTDGEETAEWLALSQAIETDAIMEGRDNG